MSSMEQARKSAIEALNEPPDDVLAYIQECAWDDLLKARRDAINGAWSIQCDSVVHRIAWLTKHTEKPTPWGDIQVDLLLDGTYEAIHEAIGFPTPLSDEDRARAREVLDRRAR
jgi:hypothetical protein